MINTFLCRFLVALGSLACLMSSCSTKFETLSSKSKLHLETFVRYLFEETTGGYVLLGEKPLCICTLPRNSDVFPGMKEHEMIIIIERGINELSRLQLKQSQYKIIFNPSDDDANAELLIVNIKKIKAVILQNLSLFQAEFGSGMSVDELLEELLFKSQFSKMMKGREALQGILLGYGVQNSLTFEIVNHLKKAAYQSQMMNPPFKGSDNPQTQEEMLCFIQKYASDKRVAVDLEKLLEDYGFCDPDSLANPRLKIPFSYHKNSVESEKIISQYVQAQKKLDVILDKGSFLVVFLNKLDQ